MTNCMVTENHQFGISNKTNFINSIDCTFFQLGLFLNKGVVDKIVGLFSDNFISLFFLVRKMTIKYTDCI